MITGVDLDRVIDRLIVEHGGAVNTFETFCVADITGVVWLYNSQHLGLKEGKMCMEIKKVDDLQISKAINLIWETFLQFEAPEYSVEGVQSFRAFIENKEIIQAVEFFGAYDNNELKGVIATNENRKHICCFFVKAEYHRQGIGKKLWEYLLDNSQNEIITVNSSPYAVPVYHKLGFVDTDIEQLTDGIRYTPMKFER